MVNTRARSNQMLKRERERLARLLVDYVKANGGKMTVCDFSNVHDLTLATKAGELHITPYGEWIACRFENIELAKRYLPAGPGHRLNPNSGKWNWHFGRETANYAFSCFTTELTPLLNSERPATCAAICL